MTTTTEIVLRAEHLLPGDVILTDAYDEHGMSTVYRDRVTSTRLFTKRVRVNYEGGSVSIPRDTELRVERPATYTRAALGHTCIRQVAPGAPVCGRPADVDETHGPVVRPYCSEHDPRYLECIAEFGPHDDHSDCQRMLDTMSASAYDLGMDYPEYDPQQDYYERFGRPAFPNEY